METPDRDALRAMLRVSASAHRCLCPRQVLGVRMGLLGGALLGLTGPRTDKRLLVIAETDGCAVDGLTAATGCAVGKRTLRIEDYGKVAATFVDCGAGRSVRLVPSPESRTLAWAYVPDAESRWHAQLAAYQIVPTSLLLRWEWVSMLAPVGGLVGTPGSRVSCQTCGEEVMNQREVTREGAVLCRACAGTSYYVTSATRPAGSRYIPGSGAA